MPPSKPLETLSASFDEKKPFVLLGARLLPFKHVPLTLFFPSTAHPLPFKSNPLRNIILPAILSPFMSFDLDVNRLLSVPSMSSPGAANPTWQARYEELLQWRSERGDTCVPKAEGALGRWVARQRELKRSGST